MQHSTDNPLTFLHFIFLLVSKVIVRVVSSVRLGINTSIGREGGRERERWGGRLGGRERETGRVRVRQKVGE
jgi:hypothetical protein